MNFVPQPTSNGPTHEYIDCEIVNNSTTDLSPIPVIFNSIKTSQIVDDCSEYYLSVTRWSLDSGLPQIIPQIKLYNNTGSNNINETAYVVNIGYDGIGATPSKISFFDTVARSVTFEPEDLTITPPLLNPSGSDDVYTNPYYFIHSIGNFLAMVNKTISLAWNSFIVNFNSTYPNNQIPTDPSPPPPTFDWNGNIITLSCALNWIYSESNPFNLYITFNTELHNLFDTFPYKFLDKSLTANDKGKSYAMMFYKNQWESTYTDGNPLQTYFVYNQEGSSVPSWSPVQSIVFQTSTIPVNPSKTGAPTYTGANLKESIQASGISNILTDFQIPLDRGDEMTNSVLYYASSGEYRLFDLMSNGGLLNLNISIFWKDRLGFIHPFLLKNGASGSIKILLRKKSFNGLPIQ